LLVDEFGENPATTIIVWESICFGVRVNVLAGFNSLEAIKQGKLS